MLIAMAVVVIVLGTIVEVGRRRRANRLRPGIGYEDTRVAPTPQRSAEKWAALKAAANQTRRVR